MDQMSASGLHCIRCGTTSHAHQADGLANVQASTQAQEDLLRLRGGADEPERAHAFAVGDAVEASAACAACHAAAAGAGTCLWLSCLLQTPNAQIVRLSCAQDGHRVHQ